MKSFESWETEDLQLTFGLKRVESLPALDTWLATQETLTPTEITTIETLRQTLREEIDVWNEEEVKMFFITDLVKLVNFRRPDVYKTFAQRTLETKIRDLKQQEITMRGRVELVVSAGKQRPRQPFFFIHEYKPKKGASNDPLGQLLAAMFVTQHLNQPSFPLCGVYVLGQWWHFVVLDKLNYAVADTLDAAKKDDLAQIVKMLKSSKQTIETFLGLI